MAFSTSANTIERRLGEVTGGTSTFETDSRLDEVVVDALKKLGNAVPRSPSEMGKLQRRLVAASYRRNEAVPIFFGIRIAVALAFFALFALPIVLRPSLMLALGACGIGYVLPGMLLARKAKRRQHLIRLGLPDALDLLVVSVEAGLGLDQAIQRVGDEMKFAHRDLAEEMR